MGSNRGKTEDRLEQLADLMLSGSASAEEFEELLDLLRASKSDQQKLAETLAIHADLGLVVNPPRSFSAEELRLIAKQRSEASADLLAEVPLSGPCSERSWLATRRLGGALLAVCASLMLAYLAFQAGRWGAAAAPQLAGNEAVSTGPAVSVKGRPREAIVSRANIGSITRTVGSDLNLKLRGSDRLSEGDFLEFSKGLVEMRIDDGITVVAVGPARFRLISKEELRLDFGRLTATVGKGFEGFQVTTEEAVFTDLGTSFSVDAEFGEAAVLRVHSGEVEALASTDDGLPKKFVEGEAVRVASADQQPSYVAFDGRVERPLDSLEKPHVHVLCEHDTYLVGGQNATVVRGDREVIWVKLDLREPQFCRRGLLGFDLSDLPRERLVGARLVLTVLPNTYADEVEPSNQESFCDWLFRVSGVWDDTLPRWDETTANSLNTPGRRWLNKLGLPEGPRGTSPVGDFVIVGRGKHGQRVVVDTPELLEYLRFDRDGWITLMVNRLSGLTWNVESEDRVVHSFASSEHSSLPAPTLELWFDEATSFTDR